MTMTTQEDFAYDPELVYNSPAVRAARAALDEIGLNLDVREFLRARTMPLDNLRHELYDWHQMPNSEGLGETFERHVHAHRFEYFSERNRPAILDRLGEDLGFIYLPFNVNAVAGPMNQDSAWVLAGQTFSLMGAMGNPTGTRRIGIELCISPPPNATAEFITLIRRWVEWAIPYFRNRVLVRLCIVERTELRTDKFSAAIHQGIFTFAQEP